MTWVIINITTSAVVTCLVAYLLGVYGHRFNAIERVGLGIMGGASFLTIGPILARHVLASASPYDDWSGALLRIGCTLVLLGVAARIEGYQPSCHLSPRFPRASR